MALSDIQVKPMQVFWNSANLGSTSGGVEVAVEVQSTDIITDQDGTAPVDAYQTGTALTVSMTLMELNAANYNAMIGDATGGNLTPSSGTEVSGYGSSRDFGSMLALCQELKLKPVGAADETTNWTFFKAIPIVESLSFASDAAKTMSVSFRVFKDSTKNSAISYGCYGDATQDLS